MSDTESVDPGTPVHTSEPGMPHDYWDTRVLSERTEAFAEAPQRTNSAGLLFLVSLLSRLGIDALLRGQAELIEREFALTLIHRLAALLGIAPDDPVVRSLPALSSGLEFEGADRSLAATWSRSMRHSCAAEAGISLRALVMRPGGVASTSTHIDVFFDHRQADVRIRRVGLDVDPGWVPWFGRVVHFHYRYGELIGAE